jgi:hypothetical protein
VAYLGSRPADPFKGPHLTLSKQICPEKNMAVISEDSSEIAQNPGKLQVMSGN